jgi:O-antigen/teichoic acid export membrane protein
MTTARVIARNTSVRALGEVLSKVASLAFYVVMARELGREAFGEFTFALSLALLLTGFAALGIDQVITRAVARDRQIAGPLMTDALTVKIGLGLVGIVVAVVVVLVGDFNSTVRTAVALLAVATVIELISKIFAATFQGLDDMLPVAASLLIQRFSTAAVGIVLLLSGAGVVTVAVVYLGGSVLALVYIAARLAARGVAPERGASAARARALVRSSWALGVTLIFSTALFRIDATLLSLLKGNGAVGIYGVAYRLFESTLFLSIAFATALLPTLSRSTPTTSPSIARVYELSSKVATTILLPLGTGFVLFARPVVELLYSDEFDPSVGPVQLLGAAAVLYGVTYLTSYVLISQGRQNILPWATGAILAVNVGLNFALIPHYSYNGAAAATSISEALMAVVLVIAVWRVAGAVSPLRILTGPLVGCAAMVAVTLAVGSSLAVAVLAVAVYVLVLLAVERRLFPADLRQALATVRRRSAVA